MYERGYSLLNQLVQPMSSLSPWVCRLFNKPLNASISVLNLGDLDRCLGVWSSLTWPSCLGVIICSFPFTFTRGKQKRVDQNTEPRTPRPQPQSKLLGLFLTTTPFCLLLFPLLFLALSLSPFVSTFIFVSVLVSAAGSVSAEGFNSICF